MIRERFDRFKCGRLARHAASNLALFLIVGFASLPAQEPEQPNRNGRNPAPQNDSARPAPPPINQPVPNPTARTNGDQEGADGSDEAWYAFTLTDALVAVFTLALTVVSIRQFRQMRKQTDEMRRQASLMDGQLTAAKEAADAARRSADIAVLTLEISQRAYMAFTDWVAVRVAVNEPLSLRIAAQNIGRTAATIVIREYQMKATDNVVRPTWPPWIPNPDQHHVLVPSASIIHDFPPNRAGEVLTTQQVADFIQGKTFLHCVHRITYLTFGKRHWVEEYARMRYIDGQFVFRTSDRVTTTDD